MTLALAEASHRWVETPVRRLGFRGSLLALRAHLDGLTPRGLRWATAMAVLAVLAYGAVVAGAPRQTTTEATLAAIADAFGVRRRDVRLVSGATHRTKVVDVVIDNHRGAAALAELLGE